MPRATNSVASRQRKKKVFKKARGNYGGRRKLWRTVRETVNKGQTYAYRDRRTRKREFRKLWIARINAASRACGLNYSRFMRGLKLANIDINRKMLAEIAATDEVAFGQLVEQAKQQLDTAR